MGRGRLRLVMAALVAALCAFPAAASAQDDGPDGEVVDLLKQLIQTNTSNPPGNEQQIAELLQARLAPLGFETEIIPTPTPGKAHFIARLRAANPTAKPLLLAGHEDVVGVERDLWSVDPFAGLVRGGDIFGRGAMDFKGGLAAFTVAASRIARAKPALTRDIDPARRGRRGGRRLRHRLARQDQLRQDRRRRLAQRGRLGLRGRRRHPAPDGHHHDRQELAVGDARDARHLDPLVAAAARLRARPPHARAQPHRALRAGDAEALERRSAATCARGRAASAAAARATSASCSPRAPPSSAAARRARSRAATTASCSTACCGRSTCRRSSTAASAATCCPARPRRRSTSACSRRDPAPGDPRAEARDRRPQGQGHADRYDGRVGRRDARALRQARQAAAVGHRHRALPRARARGQARSGRRPGSRRRCSRRAPTPCRGASAASRSTASTRTRSRAPSWPTCTATTSASRSAASKRGRTCSRASSAPPPGLG